MLFIFSLRINERHAGTYLYGCYDIKNITIVLYTYT